MNEETMFDEEEGIRRKHAGQEAVSYAEPEWQDHAQAALDFLSYNRETITADDLREEMRIRGVGEPHHQNCWGAALTKAKHRGRLKKTNRTQPSKIPSRHYGDQRVWLCVLHHKLTGKEMADV